MYYFRVVAANNMWQCKRGRTILSVFDNFGDALALAEMEASVYRPSEVSVRHAEGYEEVVSRYTGFY